jgi:LIM domain kinase 1
MEAISNIRSSALRAAEKKEESDTSSTAWSQVTVKQDGTRAFGNANDSLPLQHQHMESTAHKRDQHATDGSLSDEPLLQRHEQASLIYTDYSTSVVRSGKDGPPNLSSILTVRPSPNLANQPKPAEETKPGGHNEQEQELMGQPSIATLTTDSRLSTNSFHTAHTPSVMFDLDTVSIAGATEGGSTVRSEIIGGLHRFTLIKPGNISNKLSKGSTQSPTASTSWSPFQFFFSSFVSSKGSSGNASKVSSGGIAGKGSTAAAKCDLCHKRLGWKPVLECDDCGLRSASFFTTN